jgi:hypothetical protein
VAAQSAVRRSRTARSPPPSIWRNGVGRADAGAIVPATRCVPVWAARHPLSGGCALVRPSAGSRPAFPLRAGRTARWPRRKRTPRPSARPGFVPHRARTTRPLPFGRGSGSAPARCLSRGAGWRGAPACHPAHRPRAQATPGRSTTRGVHPLPRRRRGPQQASRSRPRRAAAQTTPRPPAPWARSSSRRGRYSRCGRRLTMRNSTLCLSASPSIPVRRRGALPSQSASADRVRVRRRTAISRWSA